MNALLPSIWLIVLIAGMPLLSETIYTSSLPSIATALNTSAPMMEYTLTIYLASFSIGVLAWGKFSDKFGRKPGILIGLVIFILGTLGCYCSQSITVLMISRFVQGFGGSVGSVLSQAICRDAFHGSALGRAYSSVASALAVFPALGPGIGGIIAEHLGWRSIFIFIFIFALLLSIMIIYRLPETHHSEKRSSVSLFKVALSLLRDRKVLGFGLLVAGCNGILFSYYAEGPFYLIKMLGLTPSQYGLSFIGLAFFTMLGGLTSKRLQHRLSSIKIMNYGLLIILLATSLSSVVIILHNIFNEIPSMILIVLILLTLMGAAFGICMVTSNALALALIDYKWCIGTASSLFGFFYYFIISLFTLGMGALHNGTLLVMPLYFLSISLFMYFVKKLMIK